MVLCLNMISFRGCSNCKCVNEENPTNSESLEKLLLEISDRKHWPAGGNTHGAHVTNVVQKVKMCMGIMLHAPVAHYSDGELNITPLSPISNDEE